MATVQCKNRHFYDDRRYSYCPYCPVEGLTNASLPETQAAPMSRPGIPLTEPAASVVLPGAASRPVANNAAGRVGNVTVGIFQKHVGGVDPVVGWLVCTAGVNKGRDYRLHSDRNIVGRAPNMDICIEGDETISRENHCQIAYSPRSKTFNLIPGDGRNLIYRNGKDVFAAEQLAAYDRIDIGEGSYLFVPFCNDEFEWETFVA
jgi:hypothetical protein